MSVQERAAAPASVELVISPRLRDLGGFEVRRVLPSSDRRLVGPFIFFDHIGPSELPAGQGIDVRPHPHIGLATVTYLFEGELVHRDSLGYEQTIEPREVNWMTAGRGIVHSERTGAEQRARASRVHGIQSWVALPLEHEEIAPSFVHYPSAVLPVIEAHGVRMRLIAGAAFGERSPVATLSELFYLEADLEAASTLRLPDGFPERAAYVAAGEVTIDGTPYREGDLVIFRPAVPAAAAAGTRTKLMLFGGAPLEGERHIWWNFVSSSRERIEQAKRDWKAGRFDRVPGDPEFIPLPD